MNISDAGAIYIAVEEGIIPRRYKDSVGVWTYGIGHTKAAGPPDPVKIIENTTLQAVVAVFLKDLRKYVAAVNKTGNWNQQETNALTAFAFNLGEGNLRQLTNGRTKAEILKAWPRYNKAAGKYSAAIAQRRKREIKIFTEGQYGATLVPVYKATDAGRPIWNSRQMVDLAPYLTYVPAPAGNVSTTTKIVTGVAATTTVGGAAVGVATGGLSWVPVAIMGGILAILVVGFFIWRATRKK